MSRRPRTPMLAAALGVILLLGRHAVARGPAESGTTGAIGSETPGELLARNQDLGGRAGSLSPSTGQGPMVPGTNLSVEEIRRIDGALLENILEISDPSERSLALVEAAQYKLLTRDLETARRALDNAADAALQILEPLRRDLRLVSIQETLIDLAQEDLNSAIADVSGTLSLDPAPSGDDRVDRLEQALAAFNRAAELSALIERPSYRAEAIYFAAEQQAQGGQSIGFVVTRDPGRLEGDDAALEAFERLTSQYIDGAAEWARRIDIPVWRDVALASVATASANADAFEAAARVARSIPGLEIRFEALVTVAEAEARRGSSQHATDVYAEAARTVASIPIADLRGTLTDVLIESLITSGRFPDARRCIVLYSDDVDRLEALGAVAESMGARGLSDEARDWIRREGPSASRDQLFRRVNQGVLSTLQRYGNDSYLGIESF